MPLFNPIKSLMAKLPGPAAQKPLPDQAILMDRRSAAEAAMVEADRMYEIASLAVETDQPGAAALMVEATEARALAKEKLRTVMAAQREAAAQHAEHGRQVMASDQKRQDATIANAWAGLPGAAKEVENALQHYVQAYTTFTKVYETAIAASVGKPRVRQDLLINQGLGHLVSLEIARIAPEGLTIPGKNSIALVTGTKSTSLVDHFTSLVNTIKEGLKF